MHSTQILEGYPEKNEVNLPGGQWTLLLHMMSTKLSLSTGITLEVIAVW